MTTYRGRCHCGAVQWTMTCDSITKGVRCNCSVCVRKGALMSPVWHPASAFEWTNRDALKPYVFGDKMMTHWFCPTCGVHTFGETMETPARIRVNLGCLEGLDVLTLPFEIIDGRSF